ncbi:hypothetical protein ABZV93_24940 [Actinopolymorpha sp. NPDC004070]|uniref:hypothetical protein n=1 Tax=Actinopolymorpha sp. NPDC004070 TaxID=3154548 RepID=UPI0033B3F3B2
MRLDHVRGNNHLVHHVARLLAAAEVTAQIGQRADLVGPQTRVQVGGVTLQVSARLLPGSPWQVRSDRPVVEDAEAVVFVDLTGDEPNFYVAPAEWVREDVTRENDEWLATQPGGTRPRNPSSTHHAIPFNRIRIWHNHWDILSVAGQAHG